MQAELQPLGLVPSAIPDGALLFGRWLVVQQLAEGATTSVYRAHDQHLNVDLALKVFDPIRCSDPLARRRFHREFSILRSFDHPGVARALAFEEGEDFDVLALEWIEGELLEDKLKRGSMGIEPAINLFARLADIVEAVHTFGVIHRDLKPSNIVLHPERGPVVLDFGVAWFTSAMSLTRTGALVGSPRYLAPEMFEGSEIDGRVDVFALGAMLFEALTGQPLRPHDDIVDIVESTPSRPSPIRLREDVPARVDDVVRRAAAERPELRHATAGELADDLRSSSRWSKTELEPRLSCTTCGTPAIVSFPMCPGCGVPQGWALDPGEFTVQLLEVRDPGALMQAILRRYPDILGASRHRARARLARPPLVLASGVSERSAEALASLARDARARPEIIRARSLIGPAVRPPEASQVEMGAALGLHFATTMIAGGVLALAGAPLFVLGLVPVGVSMGGFLAARRYVRRPLLGKGVTKGPYEVPSKLQGQLAALKTNEARHLAAAAIARATPLFRSQIVGLSDACRKEAEAALSDALQAVVEADVHRKALHALDRFQSRRTEKSTRDENATPSDEETRVAYDLAARRALGACRALSLALEGRSR